MKALKVFTFLASLLGIAALGWSTATAEEEEIRFRKGEFDVSPFGAYTDKAGGKWGAGAAVTYFVLENVGVGGSTYWTDLEGTFIDNFEAEGYFRIPIFKRIAPYAVGGLGYQFDHNYWFETLGVGVDFRVFKRITAFSDVQYRFVNSSSRDGALIRLGARFSF